MPCFCQYCCSSGSAVRGLYRLGRVIPKTPKPLELIINKKTMDPEKRQQILRQMQTMIQNQGTEESAKIRKQTREETDTERVNYIREQERAETEEL